VYLKKLYLRNIKCFEDVALTFPVREGSHAGWNVILGKNGQGKSTILRSIALALLPLREAIVASEEHAGRFERRGAEEPFQVKVDLVFQETDFEQSGPMLKKHSSRAFNFSPYGLDS
jgi:DNA repair exonuclease SbcCD ATPase subunit